MPMVSRPCPDCNNPQRPDRDPGVCVVCQGTGDSPFDRTKRCPSCKGDGRCSECGGTGYKDYYEA